MIEGKGWSFICLIETQKLYFIIFTKSISQITDNPFSTPPVVISPMSKTIFISKLFPFPVWFLNKAGDFHLNKLYYFPYGKDDRLKP